MSGSAVGPVAGFWDDREARTVSRPATGARSPAARAAVDRAASAQDAEAFWEPHHAAMQPGGGSPNAVLVDVVGELTAGSALDLGCGQGGDALWLASRGWVVTGVDVSTTAVQRLAAQAAAQGLSERVHVERHDLSVTFPDGAFDLVNAQYFHSPVAMDRAAVLARAAGAVAPGGMLLVVDHASVPPWSWADPNSVFPTARQTLDSIGLDLNAWEIAVAQDRDRQATGPDNRHATVTDTVLALVRRAPVPA